MSKHGHFLDTKDLPTVLIWQSDEIDETSGKLAIFDLDWTLVRPNVGIFPKNPKDIYALPGRREKLKELIEEGYDIVIVTNQKVGKFQSKENIEKRLERVSKVLGIPVTIFAALAEDKYRKPQTGLWKLIKKMFDPDEAFYVGDAAGRRTDFDNSDKKWAEKVEIPFYLPEKIFKVKVPKIRKKKMLAIMVGVPGSGKSTFVEDYLVPAGYVHLSGDILKTRPKIITQLKKNVKEGNSVVIDATNPTEKGRQEYIDIVQSIDPDYDYVIYYCVRNGEPWNALREKPVPKIALNRYYKNFEAPSENTTEII